MRLRTREEARKWSFHRLGERERGKVLERLSRRLMEHDEVLLAVVYGGFAESEVFRDVDVAVFTGYRVSYEDAPAYEEELSRELEEEVGLPVDVRLVDYAPPWFRVKALSGILVKEVESGLRARLRFKSLQELRDFKAKGRR